MIKIRAEDKWFSLYIRARDNFRCRRCARSYKPYEEKGDNSHLKGLHNAHCFGRGDHSTRWNENNCATLCYGCHSFLDQHPKEKEAFFRKILGDKEYDDLEALSRDTIEAGRKMHLR